MRLEWIVCLGLLTMQGEIARASDEDQNCKEWVEKNPDPSSNDLDQERRKNLDSIHRIAGGNRAIAERKVLGTGEAIAKQIEPFQDCLKLISAIEEDQEKTRQNAILDSSLWRDVAAATGSIQLRVNAGYTTKNWFPGGPGATSTVRLDNEEFVGGAELGWFDKPILRDVWLAWVSDGDGARKKIDQYKRDKKSDPMFWAFLDAFKVDAFGGYGTTLHDEDGEDNFETKTGFNAGAKLKYSVPIDKILGVNLGLE